MRTAGPGIPQAVVVTLAVHTTGMLLFVAVATSLHHLDARSVPTWLAACLFVLAGMAYAPLAGLAFPNRNPPYYEHIRRPLKEAGATPGQERAVTWVSAPLALLGTGVLMTSSVILLAS
ncbi:hypothetical protein [Actinomadura sp. WAC 06369]|uniref:hypothetical protein n=1 Tax=Actinomadura sp. WAC 06369 TaxID=2203193 RepID=UPI0013156DFE|nr:hypothetical protein [Actinomadura sp. WAC 06369]